MRFERAHLWNVDNGIKVSATVEVPGIGMVEFECALSQETCERVREEVLVALRVRMGQKLEQPNTDAPVPPVPDQ